MYILEKHTYIDIHDINIHIHDIYDQWRFSDFLDMKLKQNSIYPKSIQRFKKKILSNFLDFSLKFFFNFLGTFLCKYFDFRFIKRFKK